jgi:hypothetical protein
MSNNAAALVTVVSLALVNILLALYSYRKNSSRDLLALKRQTYSELLSSAEELFEAKTEFEEFSKAAKQIRVALGQETRKDITEISKRLTAAQNQMNKSLASVDLLASSEIVKLSEQIEIFSVLPREDKSRIEYFNLLRNLLRADLGNKQFVTEDKEIEKFIEKIEKRENS